MKNEHNRYLGLCLPYALGKLNPRNRHFFENHLKTGCEECNKELAEIYEAIGLLPLTLPPKPIPPHLRHKVMAAIQTGARAGKQVERQKLVSEAPAVGRPVVQRPWYGYAVVLVSIVILLSLALYTNSLINRIDAQEQLLANQQQELIALRDEVQKKTEILKVLQAPRIDMVIMNGLEPSPAGYGKIIWDPEKKVAIFQVANLPQTPADKDYQLWVIKDNKPVSAGVFSVRDEKEKESFFKVLALDVTSKREVGAFAVTLEPKGGVPQPTGAMYLIGNP